MPDFHRSLVERGRPAELLTVEYFRARGIDAQLNDAQDYEGLSSHDVVIAGELWDVKTDFVAGTTKRIFVERASLEHTHAFRFCYFIPTPYGLDMRIFLVRELIALYNAKEGVMRADGTHFERYIYSHGVAGDQATNDGVFLSLVLVKEVGLAPWEVCRELTKAA